MKILSSINYVMLRKDGEFELKLGGEVDCI